MVMALYQEWVGQAGVRWALLWRTLGGMAKPTTGGTPTRNRRLSMRVLIAMMMHETNTPFTGARDLQRFALTQGAQPPVRAEAAAFAAPAWPWLLI